jgi:hypothetical protein
MYPCESNTLAVHQTDKRFMAECMTLHAMIVVRLDDKPDSRF